MASAQVNGHKEHDAQAAFLDQWLQLKDAVLADRHPRFKLPAAVKERLQPAIKAASTSTHTSAAQLPGLSNGSGSARLPSGSHNSSAASLVNTKAFAQNTSTAAGLAASKSGIDPVLLTKSEDLIRAEMQLKRQRIERQLKDSADQRKHGFRARDNEETAPLVALTETLKRALEIVKPISGLEPPANAQTAASDSFDENSYYSSQANDWSSEDASPKGRKAEAASSLHQTAGLASNASKNHAFSVERLDRQPPPQSHTLNQIDAETTYDAEREDSDEYSPPAADAFSGPDADADAMDIDDADSSSEFVPQDAHVPSLQVPLVTSHLTQLAAPQPARVSPLALAKPPGIGQSHTSNPSITNNQSLSFQSTSTYRQQFESDDSTTSAHASAQTSPAGVFKKQKPKNKKRKREAEAAANKTRNTRDRPAIASPEPYIKPEPMSPPPFAAPADLQRSRTRPHQLPPDVEIVSGPRQPLYQEPLPPAMQYGSNGVSSPGLMRVASPATYARPRRDDQDLRRVASLHAAHQPMSPMARAYSPAGYRTVSQPYSERAPRYEDRALPMQYVRSERSLSPPHIRAVREAPVPVMQPPPPPSAARRIVVDQYGNRYYANEPEPQPRMSVAPQLRPESEVMYERAPSRQSVVYASHPEQSVYEDNGPRMPPPPPPVRRVMEQPEAGHGDYRVYRQREYSRAPEPQYYREEAGGPVYIRDGPAPRASVYPPEAVSTAGGYAPRAYSVRPEMEPVRYMSRQPSVAPQHEYARVAEAAGRAPMAAPPGPMRAVSGMAGSEYGRPVEVGYSYGQAASAYAAPGPRYVEEGAGAAREVYVDQYGREVRRVGY